jgi:hypothetical protein
VFFFVSLRNSFSCGVAKKLLPILPIAQVQVHRDGGPQCVLTQRWRSSAGASLSVSLYTRSTRLRRPFRAVVLRDPTPVAPPGSAIGLAAQVLFPKRPKRLFCFLRSSCILT